MERKLLRFATILIFLDAYSLRPRCKDSCYTKYLEGDDRSNCLSECDAYHAMQDRKEVKRPPAKPIPELN